MLLRYLPPLSQKAMAVLGDRNRPVNRELRYIGYVRHAQATFGNVGKEKLAIGNGSGGNKASYSRGRVVNALIATASKT